LLAAVVVDCLMVAVAVPVGTLLVVPALLLVLIRLQSVLAVLH
jgi:hypothetical protein